MTPKTFESELSDLKVEVYESGYIAITDNENQTITLGCPPNARIDLILQAIEYVNKEKWQK